MKKIWIYHHLGLGDHIINNGLVRNLVHGYDQSYLFCKQQNLESVSFMYRDLDNIVVFPFLDDEAVKAYIAENNLPNVFLIGFERADMSVDKFDEAFYKQCGIDFSKRWSDFFVKRDHNKENRLFKEYGLKENEYVFIHDDVDRGFEIDESFVENRELPRVRPIKGLTKNIFDYCYLLENARELHFMDSSFRLLFDSLPERYQRAYYHTYVRGHLNNATSNSLKKYIVVEKSRSITRALRTLTRKTIKRIRLY